MRHQQCRKAAELDGKIPVADRVQAVLGGPVEAQQSGGHCPINGIGSACQGRCAQGHYVHPLAAILQTLGIPNQHLVPGQQVVPEGHRLGSLQMGEAGHDGVRLALGEIQQARFQAIQFLGNHVDLVPQVQTDIGGYLIVAASAGVQLLARNTDTVGEACFNVHVHVFKADRPLEVAGLDVCLDAFQALNDLVPLVGGKHANLGQHGGMGNGTGDVVMVQALVKSHRCSKFFNKGIGGFTEAPAPGFFRACGLVRLFLIRHGLSFLLTARHHLAGAGYIERGGSIPF